MALADYAQVPRGTYVLQSGEYAYGDRHFPTTRWDYDAQEFSPVGGFMDIYFYVEVDYGAFSAMEIIRHWDVDAAVVPLNNAFAELGSSVTVTNVSELKASWMWCQEMYQAVTRCCNYVSDSQIASSPEFFTIRHGITRPNSIHLSTYGLSTGQCPCLAGCNDDSVCCDDCTPNWDFDFADNSGLHRQEEIPLDYCFGGAFSLTASLEFQRDVWHTQGGIDAMKEMVVRMTGYDTVAQAVIPRDRDRIGHHIPLTPRDIRSYVVVSFPDHAVTGDCSAHLASATPRRLNDTTQAMPTQTDWDPSASNVLVHVAFTLIADEAGIELIEATLAGSDEVALAAMLRSAVETVWGTPRLLMLGGFVEGSWVMSAPVAMPAADSAQIGGANNMVLKARASVIFAVLSMAI